MRLKSLKYRALWVLAAPSSERSDRKSILYYILLFFYINNNNSSSSRKSLEFPTLSKYIYICNIGAKKVGDSITSHGVILWL